MSRAPHGIHQGVYVITSTGRLLGKIDGGWPDYDPEITLRGLRQTLAAYKQLPRENRIKSEPIPPDQQVRFGWMDFSKPDGTLDLRVTKRGYPYPGMTTFDERHPRYLGLGKLWLKPSEYAAFLPQNLAPGSSTAVTGPSRDRLVFHSHMMKGSVPWDESMVESANMTSRIASVEGPLVHLQIEADYRLKGNNQWNTGRYQGRFLAKAAYNRETKTFQSFEGVILGAFTAGKRMDNVHAGELTSTIASAFTMNDSRDPDANLPPSEWMYGYGLEWCRRP